jgi:hypothetical protein
MGIDGGCGGLIDAARGSGPGQMLFPPVFRHELKDSFTLPPPIRGTMWQRATAGGKVRNRPIAAIGIEDFNDRSRTQTGHSAPEFRATSSTPKRVGAAGTSPGSAQFVYAPDAPGRVQTGPIRAISTDCAAMPSRSRVILLEARADLAIRRARGLRVTQAAISSRVQMWDARHTRKP